MFLTGSERWRREVLLGYRLMTLADLGYGVMEQAQIEAMPDKEERIVARRLDEHRANMVKTIEGIKALAEAQAQP